MKTLFVEKANMELRYERACLLVYHEGKRISSVPLTQLERIVVAPHVILAAGVLGVVAEKEVALLVLNNRYPNRVALLAGSMTGDVHRRLLQYQLFQDEAFRLHWAKQLVWLKMLRQQRLLANLRVSRPDLRLPMTHGLKVLQPLVAELHDAGDSLSLASLRGKEGAAAAAYFQAISQAFPPSLQFSIRNRRPPKDPVNACLSLGYTLFYQEAVNALKTVGLDPAIGCLHELFYHRESLACDLLEPLRPLIDRWVYRLFQSHILRREDFTWDEEVCWLHSTAKQRFYEEYRQIAPVFRRLLRRYAHFSAVVVGQYERAAT